MERQAGPPAEQITDIGMLKALAHPRRQAIMQRLSVHGPATSTTLARDLGWNTGATSYHLRELAKYGLVEELPDVRTDVSGGGARSRETCASLGAVSRPRKSARSSTR